MNKKWWIAGAGFTLGAVMLTVSGLSAMANTSGYEAYKSALKNTKAQASLTALAELTVTDNGTKTLTGKADVKWNHASNAGSVSATLDDGTKTHSADVFRQDGKVIVKHGDSDVYKVIEHKAPKAAGHAMPHSHKAAEQAIDLLAGHVRELTTVETESDGSKHAALHLSGSQIPAAVKAAFTLFVSGAADHHSFGSPDQDHPKNSLPKLTGDIKVEAVNLGADITPDNVLERQTAEIRVSGIDDEGKSHILVLQFHADFSDVNHTVPERIDLTGKQTEEIKRGGHKHGWHH